MRSESSPAVVPSQRIYGQILSNLPSEHVIVFCPTSKFRATAGRRPLRCPITAEPLEFGDFPPFNPDLIEPSLPGHWRYSAMLPVVADARELITLGEGWTPLIRGRWRSIPVHWKLDSLMPTGSFKDRGVSVMVNWLAGLDVKVVVDDSSGNAGASLACYGARARMETWIYVPESTPIANRTQIGMYGADLIEVPGPRENAAKAAKNATYHSKDTAYASHVLHPAFLMGQMTCAWEIWEQLGCKVPDWLIFATGQGGTMLGTWRGFQQLKNAGLIEKLPRLVAVQVEPYIPYFEAYQNQWDRVRPGSAEAPSIAEGIAISRPVRDATVLAAIYRSQGIVLAVQQENVLAAWEKLAEKGVFVEPTSAAVAAGLNQLDGEIAPGEVVVAIMTGHGLKNPLPAIDDPSEE